MMLCGGARGLRGTEIQGRVRPRRAAEIGTVGIVEKLQEKLEKDIEELRSAEGYLYAGKPHYTTLFGRDSLISAWQMLTIDPDIARSTLTALATWQGKEVNPMAEEEPGKILHQLEATPSPRKKSGLPTWPFPYYGSVDITPLFIFLINEYLVASGDIGFVESLWSALRRACRWMEKFGDKDKDLFLEYERHNPDALLHQGWRDSEEDTLKITPPVAIVEAQGYEYAALNAAAAVGKALNRSDELPFDVTARAEQLKAKFNEAFWWEEEQFYALALNGKKVQRHVVSSNPGHLLFTGIVPRARAKRIVERLFKPDIMTPFGVRTDSMSDPDFDPKAYHLGSVWPHDNWIFWKGLSALGFQAEADELKRRLLAAVDELGYVPELFGVDADGKIFELNRKTQQGSEFANRLEAWSSAALLNLISAE